MNAGIIPRVQVNSLNSGEKTVYAVLLLSIIIMLTIAVSLSAQQYSIDSLAFLPDKERRELLKQDSVYIHIKSQLKRIPKDFISLNRLGELFTAYARYDSARFAYRKSLKIRPDQPEAHTGIGLAYLREGRNQNVITALIEKLTSTDNLNLAEGEFKKALKLDPKYHKARIHMAETFLDMGGTYRKERAEKISREIIEDNPAFPGAWFMLGKAQYFQFHYEEAEKSFRKQLEHDPICPRSWVYLAMTYGLTGKSDSTAFLLNTHLPRLEDHKTLTELYTFMYPLFSDEERDFFDKLVFFEKGQYLADYWKARDPNILTEENERLTEHLERIDHVMKSYNIKNKSGFDNRGRIYLRYGEPDEKYVAGVEKARESIRTGTTESWVYESIEKDLAFDFVDKNSLFIEVPYLSAEDYAERWHLGGVYSHLAHRSGRDLMIEAMDRKNAAEQRAPREKFWYEYPSSRFPFPFTISQFRGDEGNTDVLLDYGLPFTEFVIDPMSPVMASAEIVIHDSLGNTLDRVKRTNRYRPSITEDPRRQFALGREKLMLQPSRYRIALGLTPNESNRRGIEQFEIPVKNFDHMDLALSDILVCWNEDFKEVPARASRDFLPDHPYPFTNIYLSAPLLVYFEIYNLFFGPGDMTNYKVEFTVKAVSPEKHGLADVIDFIRTPFKRTPKVSISHDRTGSSNDENEMISLDISELPVGLASIEITVTDRVSGKIASVSRPITIMEQY